MLKLYWLLMLNRYVRLGTVQSGNNHHSLLMPLKRVAREACPKTTRFPFASEVEVPQQNNL